MVELRHLRYFVAVGEELHFGRAARRLQMSQPPLSQQIRQLEDDLRVQLFDRSRQHVALTQAGEVLLGEARRTLAQADRVREVAARTRRGESGQLRIGFVGSALYGRMPDLLRSFRREAPGVGTSVQECVTMVALELLNDEVLDVAFVRPPLEDLRIDVMTVDREALIVALPADHPLTARDLVPLAALAGEPLVLFKRHLATGYFDLVDAACRTEGFRPHVLYEEEQMQTIIGLVAAGFGVSLVPENVRHVELPGVRYRSIDGSTPILDLAMAWRLGHESPALQRFIDVVRQSVCDPAVS